jgi:hypothetical protein
MMLEPNKLIEVGAPVYRRYSMNLDEMNLPDDFMFYRLGHHDFWRNYTEILRVGDIVEVKGRGADAEFVCTRILRDADGGCDMTFRGGFVPSEVETADAV